MHESKKEILHIPGAGTMAMYVLVASLSMLFMASMLGYFFVRLKFKQWPPPGYPHIPATLWVSTVLILAASVTIQLALHAIKRGNEKKLKLHLALTAALGLLFLILQSVNWWEFVSQIAPAARHGQYFTFFFILTGLHAAHVIGGLIPLGIVLRSAAKGKYSANYHPGVRYCTIYWHFLDAIWLMLFVALMLI